MERHQWTIIEDAWTPAYPWFLVDDGLLQEAFVSEEEAHQYARETLQGAVLITNVDSLTHDTMLEAQDIRCWNLKTQRCLRMGHPLNSTDGSIASPVPL